MRGKFKGLVALLVGAAWLIAGAPSAWAWNVGTLTVSAGCTAGSGGVSWSVSPTDASTYTGTVTDGHTTSAKGATSGSFPESNGPVTITVHGTWSNSTDTQTASKTVTVDCTPVTTTTVPATTTTQPPDTTTTVPASTTTTSTVPATTSTTAGPTTTVAQTTTTTPFDAACQTGCPNDHSGGPPRRRLAQR